ncbi:MAG: hypothetical protein ABI658_30360 [Acidimicrobiales bacterium]
MDEPEWSTAVLLRGLMEVRRAAIKNEVIRAAHLSGTQTAQSSSANLLDYRAVRQFDLRGASL